VAWELLIQVLQQVDQKQELGQLKMDHPAFKRVAVVIRE
jgi:hypothetical protein